MKTGQILRFVVVLSIATLSSCGPRDSVSPVPSAPAEEPATVNSAVSDDDHSTTPSGEQQQALESIIAAGGSVDCDAKGWPTLIDMASQRASANDEIVRSLTQFPELKRLRLAVNAVSTETLSELSSLTALEEFLLQDAAISDRQIATILRSMPALKRVTFRRLSNVSDQGIAAISDCSQLEVLALIEMNQISGASINTLSQVANLRSLDLRNCGQLTLADFEKLPSLTGLSELKLAGPAVSDQVLKVVARMPSLTALTIEDAQISGDGLQQLVHAPGIAAQLRSLTIARCFGVTDDTLGILVSLPALQSLSLRDIMLTGSFLTALGQSLDEPLPLTSLVVADAFLDDESLKALPKIAPGLQRLDLHGNQGVTDQSLEVFRQLTHLKDLQLAGTGVSDPGTGTVNE